MEVVELIEAAGVRKVTNNPLVTLILSMLAGAFIALGAYFSIVVGTGAHDVWYGGVQLLKGIAFSMGLGLVIAGGAELFTGSVLSVVAYASRKVTLRAVLRNWSMVFVGNFVGAVGVVLLVLFAGVYALADGEVGTTALKIAAAKADLSAQEAFFRGILCNMMVCIAIWVALTTRTIGGKTAAFTLPIAMFVASGFEHVVANMFFLPFALMLMMCDPAFVSAHIAHLPALAGLTTGAMLHNLLYVTLGNIVGGTLFVGITYWVIYKYIPRQKR